MTLRSKLNSIFIKLNLFDFLQCATIIWFLQMTSVELFTVAVVKLDINCNNTNTCVIEEPISLRAGEKLNFVNVPNTTAIQCFKWTTSTNVSKIPIEIFETFNNLLFLELNIGLEQLPTPFKNGNQLKVITLSGNKIQNIPKEVFKNSTELEEINLQQNYISGIEDGAFDGLTKLTILILFQNKLTILKEFTFIGAINIKYLDLACNNIATIEDGAFNLPKLEEILISENCLKILSDRLFYGAPNLLNIDMRKNHLERIGHAFNSVQHLHQLQLSENEQLKDLNVVEFANLHSLISLGVEGTGLKHLALDSNGNASSFNSVSASPLTTLSLSKNLLFATNFLKQLSIFGKLEKLFIDSNKFSRWDDNDVNNVKNYFPNIDLIVTKENEWDKKWVENTLIPIFKTNNIYCNQFKYLGVYIFGFMKGGDRQIIEGTECV